jgi:hypothetical protein
MNVKLRYGLPGELGTGLPFAVRKASDVVSIRRSDQ